MSVRIVFETRGKCQDFVALCKDDGIPCAINSPICCTNTTITVRQSRSIGDREIGTEFVPLWKRLADQLKAFFPDADDEGVHCPNARSPLTSSQHQRSQKRYWINRFSNLIRLVVNKGFLSLKLTGLMCDGRSLASQFFRRLAGRGIFCVFSWFDGSYTLRPL